MRVAQAGVSAEIDPYGRRVRELPPNGWASFAVEVRRNAPPGAAEALALLALFAAGGVFGQLCAVAIERRIRIMRLSIVSTLAFIALLTASVAGAQEAVATLHLDGLSYVSFQDRRVVALPAGSTLRFRFGRPTGGSVPFSIAPADVSIPPIDLGGGAALTYRLAGPASGSVTRGSDGKPIVRLSASISATLSGTTNDGTKTYALQLTTETATAASADGTGSIAIQGMRLVESAGYVQLVGAVTNHVHAYPEPRAAVAAVLSGSFDLLPPLRSPAAPGSPAPRRRR